MIIGESLSKYHCSLYGYDKETNPVLTEKRDSCGLLVYKNVESPETSTLVSIREVVSTFDHTRHPEDNWFTHVTLQEVLRLSDYKSFWISNQSKKGFRDNYVGRYSDLCDENYFVGNKFMGMARLNTDDQLLDLIKPVMEDSAGHKFYFVHMMGNHTTFSKRYTPDFSVFKAADYANLPEHQRQIISEYDNSVLFNDYVVGAIMDLYKDKEAIVFYFPDHALDLYQTTPTYFGHARGDEKSRFYGKSIPFVIYMTEKYKERFPENARKLQQCTEKEFLTTNMIYTVMDIIGTEFKENDDVRKYSLMSENIQ